MNARIYMAVILCATSTFLCVAQSEKGAVVRASRDNGLARLTAADLLLVGDNPVQALLLAESTDRAYYIALEKRKNALREQNEARKNHKKRFTWGQRLSGKVPALVQPPVPTKEEIFAERERNCSYCNLCTTKNDAYDWISNPELLLKFTRCVSHTIATKIATTHGRPVIVRSAGASNLIVDLIILAGVLRRHPQAPINFGCDYESFELRDNLAAWFKRCYPNNHAIDVSHLEVASINMYAQPIDVVYARSAQSLLNEGVIWSYSWLISEATRVRWPCVGVLLAPTSAGIKVCQHRYDDSDEDSQSSRENSKSSKKLQTSVHPREDSPPPYVGPAPMAPAKP